MNNRGISPVIATVIIVAVAIAIAIAVAFWMTGIVGLFTGFEELQISSAYADTLNNNDQFVIHLQVKNTGTSAATIDNIFINGRPFDDTTFEIKYGKSTGQLTEDLLPNGTISVSPGSTVYIDITFDVGADWGDGKLGHGVSVEVKLHTASGKEYPKLIVLP